jgi:hypothetical protein
MTLPVIDESTPEQDGQPWDRLRDRTVALYSLQESALRRAAATLRDLVPSITVVCFHDRVGGAPSLKAAAATADLFVIATTVAKHAATGFIEANRRDKPVLYARGGGSASLLAALNEYSGSE